MRGNNPFGEESMSDIKALTQSVYGEMSQNDDIDMIVDTYFAEDFVEHEEIPGLEETGRDIPKLMFRMMRGAIPDMRAEVELLIAEDDKVMAYGAFVGTHSGEFMGMPASGQAVRIPFADILQWRDGKIAGHWGVSDMSSMFAGGA
ncbi:MAG: ester cyclase [Actinomycetota bacterium]|nr:ester cyclase [Actinomycetota bacterium]